MQLNYFAKTLKKLKLSWKNVTLGCSCLKTTDIAKFKGRVEIVFFAQIEFKNSFPILEVTKNSIKIIIYNQNIEFRMNDDKLFVLKRRRRELMNLKYGEFKNVPTKIRELVSLV